MQAENEQKQSWRIEVRAKAKSFNFKFKASKISPTWKLHRIYLLLNIHKLFFFLVNSESRPSNPPHSQRTLKSKFLRISDKLRSVFAKKPQNCAKPGPKNYLNQLHLRSKEVPIDCFGYLFGVIGLGFALHKGTILTYGFVILLCVACLLMKRCEAGKTFKYFLISLATFLASYLLLSDLNNYYFMKSIQSYGSRWVWYWKIWRTFGSKIWETL